MKGMAVDHQKYDAEEMGLYDQLRRTKVSGVCRTLVAEFESNNG